jgi:hypothetical protein
MYIGNNHESKAGTHNLVYLVYEVQDQQFVFQFQYAQKNKYTSTCEYLARHYIVCFDSKFYTDMQCSKD